LRPVSGAAGEVPRRVGLLGFSAGAHLLALTAGKAPMGDYQAVDEADSASHRADFAAFLYPVLSFAAGLRPSSAQRVLVGGHPAPEEATRWSAETYVTPGFPPVFLVQAEDDPISDPRQAPLMGEACRQAGVPAELHELVAGGHGFGMGRFATPSGEWPRWYARWLTDPARPRG
jgi:acetyl esterase/lipase